MLSSVVLYACFFAFTPSQSPSFSFSILYFLSFFFRCRVSCRRSGRSTYLPSQLASLVLEQESTSFSEQPPPSRDPASSIFTNASATCLLSATVMERSSPLEPHLNDKKSSGTSQVAAPSLSLEGDPLPLPAIPALLSGVTWRWVSEWQCSSPRLPGGPLQDRKSVV